MEALEQLPALRQHLQVVTLDLARPPVAADHQLRV
jgi:hypothetical protein